MGTTTINSSGVTFPDASVQPTGVFRTSLGADFSTSSTSYVSTGLSITTKSANSLIMFIGTFAGATGASSDILYAQFGSADSGPDVGIGPNGSGSGAVLVNPSYNGVATPPLSVSIAEHSPVFIVGGWMVTLAASVGTFTVYMKVGGTNALTLKAGSVLVVI